MDYKTIGEIYAANDSIREKFIAEFSVLNDAELNARPADEEWTIAEVVEHVAIVEDGITKICGRLLAKAQSESRGGDGSAQLSEKFLSGIATSGGMKLEAPERVRPTGTKTISETLEKFKENRSNLETLRPLFENFSSSQDTFPHPAFGDMTACDWLALLGGHELRHLKQMRRIRAKIDVSQE